MRRMKMSLSNNQLLLLDALVYYAELSNNKYKTIDDFIDDSPQEKYKTVFNGVNDYTDEDLGMNKIINLVSKDTDLTRLTIVYPDKVKDKTTSSVCFVDTVSFDVYVIYVGNYADDYNYYSDNNADGDYNDANESTFINAWIGYLLI